jgi:hypothetical protein
VSKLALAMFLDDDEEALRRYKVGDRSTEMSWFISREWGCRPSSSRRRRAQPRDSRYIAAIQISK